MTQNDPPPTLYQNLAFFLLKSFSPTSIQANTPRQRPSVPPDQEEDHRGERVRPSRIQGKSSLHTGIKGPACLMSQQLVVRGHIATSLPYSASLVDASFKKKLCVNVKWKKGHAMLFLFSGFHCHKVEGDLVWLRASSRSPSYVVDTALAVLQPLYGNTFMTGGPQLGQLGTLFRSVHLDSSRAVKTVTCFFIPATYDAATKGFTGLSSTEC